MPKEKNEWKAHNKQLHFARFAQILEVNIEQLSNMKDKVVKIYEENLTEKYGALQGATSAADLLNFGSTFGHTEEGSSITSHWERGSFQTLDMYLLISYQYYEIYWFHPLIFVLLKINTKPAKLQKMF